MLATPPEALGAPGVLEKIIALGAQRPRYPDDAPRHDDLVTVADEGLPAAAKRLAGIPV